MSLHRTRAALPYDLVENDVDVPLIGVTSYGCVNGREVLEKARMDTRTYVNPAPPSVKGAPLNPHHTHFVFVVNEYRISDMREALSQIAAHGG